MKRYIFLAILFGWVSTFFTYLGYGVDVHLEQLPIIYRLFDPSFLTNDFFTNVNENSPARIHYSKILVFLSGSERNLPFVFMLLTYLSNISISVITFYLGRMIFNKSDKTGILASAIVMAVPTFGLGYSDVVYSRLLTPSTIATPIALGAILCIFHGNLLTGMILCSLSSFVHPLMGLEMAGLLLFTYSIYRFIEANILSKKEIAKILFSLFIIAALFIFFAVPELAQVRINTDSFIYILAHFRHPHHYLPSTFEISDYVKGVVFVTAVLVIVHRFTRSQNNPYPKYSAILIYSIIVICVGGYVFVELIPTRIWVTAQVFRILLFVKWLGLVLFAGILVATGTKETTRKAYFLYALPFIFFLLLLIAKSVSLLTIAVFSSFVVTIYLANVLSWKTFAAACLLSILLLLGLVFTHKHIPLIKGLDLMKQISNSMKLDYYYEIDRGRAGVVDYALLNTPEESVFLTPPNWGQFRLMARRAIVVDFKAFPFSDKAMEEWYYRVLDCYGNPAHHGFEMIPELNQKYRNMNDDTLQSLRKKYKFSYAVLYGRTNTKFKTVYKNERYKIVALE
ncbi:hypothetical protein L0222_18130 [bacterium]|nr:hypothetical protein [bacterium]